MVQILKGDGAAILAVFVGAIVAATLIAAIATSVLGTTTVSNTVTNFTVAVPSTANTTVDLTGRAFTSGTGIIVNATNATAQAEIDTQVHLLTGTGSGGLQSVQLVSNGSIWLGRNVNVTYSYTPEGTIGDSSGRSIAGLITLFAALAIVVFIIVVFIKRGSMGSLIKGRR